MAFSTGYLGDPRGVAGGEVFGDGLDIGYSRGEWQNVIAGRFARIVSGVLQPLDGTATPVIGGVVQRNVSGAVEDTTNLETDIQDNVDTRRRGLITVDVAPGQNAPDKFAAVQASNAGDASDGLAVATGGVDTTAEFIEAISASVWLINLKNS